MPTQGSKWATLIPIVLTWRTCLGVGNKTMKVLSKHDNKAKDKSQGTNRARPMTFPPLGLLTARVGEPFSLCL
jgi:hypothetical protein